jgi:colicin import membrane protein
MVVTFNSFQETEFGKDFWGMFWVSLVLHVAIILLFTFSWKFMPDRVYYAPPSFTTVDLVTIAKPKPKKVPAKRKTAPSKPKAEKKIAIPETHKEKTPAKPVKKTVQKKEPPPREYSDKEINSRIDNLRKQVKEKRGAEQQAIAARGRITSRVMEIRYRTYYNNIWEIIRSAWTIPKGTPITPGLETIIGIRIAKDGRVLDINIEKSSENQQYDDSAIRAIEKSSPFPPMPGEEEEMEVGIRFTPEEYQ